jgi:hypothetical protein
MTKRSAIAVVLLLSACAPGPDWQAIAERERHAAVDAYSHEAAACYTRAIVTKPITSAEDLRAHMLTAVPNATTCGIEAADRLRARLSLLPNQ